MRRSVRNALSVATGAALVGSGLTATFGQSSAVASQEDAAIQPCGLRKAADVERYTGQLPPSRTVNGGRYSTAPVTTLDQEPVSYRMRTLPSGAVQHYVLSSTQTAWTLTVYNEAGQRIKRTTKTVPAAMRHTENRALFSHGAVAVDNASGDIMFATYQTGQGNGTVSRWTTSGTMRWSSSVGQLATGAVYSYHDGSPRLGVVARDAGGSIVLDPRNGKKVGTTSVTGSTVNVSTEHKDELVAVDSDGVRVHSADGKTTLNRISTLPDGEFSGVSDAVVTSDGSLLALTGYKGAWKFDSEGRYVGKITHDHTQGVALEMQRDSRGLAMNGDTVLWPTMTNGSALSSITENDINTYAGYPQGAPFGLGVGVQVKTPATYNYFADSQRPSATLEMSSGWAQRNETVTASYTVTSVASRKGGHVGAKRPLTLPTDPAAFDGGKANVRVPLPDLGPGAYEVDIKFTSKDSGEVVGADCLRYTSGAKDADLDLDSLPKDPDLRGVMLADRLGQDAFRSEYDWTDCFAGVHTLTTSTPAKCSATMTADVKAAAAYAKAHNIDYVFQVGHNGPMFTGGTAATTSAVTKLSRALPNVERWEFWNEPDNGGYFASGDEYVDKAVLPMSKGLRAADSSDTLIGGSYSTNDFSGGWWKPFLERGLDSVDQVAVHPYTGHNRSFEEHGMILPPKAGQTKVTGLLPDFQADLRRRGFEGQVIDTEHGFWVDGTYNAVTQGDRIIRKMILERAAGLASGINFQNEADHRSSGMMFTVVADQTLTSGGAAGPVFNAQVGDKPFSGWKDTGADFIYAAQFGTKGQDRTVAVWTNDAIEFVRPKLDNGTSPAVVDQYGKPVTVGSKGDIRVTGSVSYVRVPAGRELSMSTYAHYDDPLTDGAAIKASSTKNCGNGVTLSPDNAVDGSFDSDGVGDLCADKPVWAPDPDDSSPTLTVTLDKPTTVRRVLVSSQGLGSVENSLRGYTISLDVDGKWTNHTRVDDQFFHTAKSTYLGTNKNVRRIRLSNFDVNFSGNGNGNQPAFWTDGFPTEPVVTEMQAFG